MEEIRKEKEMIVDLIKEHLEKRVEAINQEIKEMETSRDMNSKSSAGDKHETSRAMAQNELEKLSLRLSQAKKDYHLVNQINLSQPYSEVKLGAYVKTSIANFFIGPGLGKMTFEGTPILSISPSSPVGSKLIGSKSGDGFNQGTMKGVIYEIG